MYQVYCCCDLKLMFYICDALRNLLSFVQFRKREKHPWRSVTFSKIAGEACNNTKTNTSP